MTGAIDGPSNAIVTLSLGLSWIVNTPCSSLHWFGSMYKVIITMAVHQLKHIRSWNGIYETHRRVGKSCVRCFRDDSQQRRVLYQEVLSSKLLDSVSFQIS